MKHLLIALVFASLQVNLGAAVSRELVIVRPDGDATCVAQAARILAAAGTHPLLNVFAEGRSVVTIDSTTINNGAVEGRAFRHLVIVAPITNTFLLRAQQREARRLSTGHWEIFGTGFLHGSFGYVESDRNPFMRTPAVAQSPYETQVVTLTGSDNAGIVAAVDAFLSNAGIVNGVIVNPSWQRPTRSVLDQNPLSATQAVVPAWLPTTLNGYKRIGVSHMTEDAYRGVKQTAGKQPMRMWMAKYHTTGVWDGVGVDYAIPQYMAGLDGRAYANSLLLMQFASTAEALAALPLIGVGAGLSDGGSGVWTGNQPVYGYESTSPGPLTLWRKDAWLILSSLPTTPTSTARTSITAASSWSEPALPANQSPTAVIAPLSSIINANTTLLFNGTNSSDPDGGIVDFTWFIDGNPIGKGNPKAWLATPGNHTVMLQISDERGATAQTQRAFVVNARPVISKPSQSTPDTLLLP